MALTDNLARFTGSHIYSVLNTAYVAIVLSTTPWRSDLLNSLLSSIYIVTVPLAFGSILNLLLARYAKFRLDRVASTKFSSGLGSMLISWMLGVIAVSALALLGVFAGLTMTIIALAFLLVSLSTWATGIDQIFGAVFEHAGGIKIASVALVGLFPALIFRSYNTFPFMTEFDGFTYSYTALQISSGSLTYVSPLASFEVLTALGSNAVGLEPFKLYWSTPFLFYVFFALSIFLFAFHVTKSAPASFFAVILASLSQGSGMINDLIHTSPKAFIQVLFPVMLYFWIRALEAGERKSRTMIYPLGAAAISSLAFYVLSSPKIYVSLGRLAPAPAKILLFPYFYINEQAVALSLAPAYLQTAYAVLFSSVSLVAAVILLRLDWTNSIFFFVILSGSIFLSPEQGFAAIVILGVIALFARLSDRAGTILCIAASSMVAVFLFNVSSIVDWFYSNGTMLFSWSEILSSPIYLPYSWKVRFLFSLYPALVVFLAFIGSIIWPALETRTKSITLSLAFALSTLVLLFFLPLSGSFRLLTYVTPLLTLFASTTLLVTYRNLFSGNHASSLSNNPTE